MTEVAAPPSPRTQVRFGARTLAVCTALLLIFATLAHYAVISKSPTYDEPLHALAAWLQVHFGDFRIDPEDPPLWKYWAGIANPASMLQFPHLKEYLDFSSHDVYMEWPFVVRILYQTPGNVEVSDIFVQRSRMMMLFVGVVLGAIIAFWSWRLAGSVAAIFACILFSFDPNFLGHSALVKNDVPLSLVMLAAIYAVWKIGRHVAVWNTVSLALLCGAAINIKFSAVLLGPIVALLLLIRALLPRPWPVFRTQIQSKLKRIACAVAISLFAAIISYASIWACYQFRFRPAPELQSKLDINAQVAHAAHNTILAQHPELEQVPPAEVASFPPGAFTRAILFCNDHRLFPQSFLTGLLYTYQSSLLRSTYLMGQYSRTGWWYYFPVAMLLKSTMALIIGSFAALATAIYAFRRRLLDRANIIHDPRTWTALCLSIPPAIYLLAAMSSNLNLGLRHVLPVYPFLFIAVGLASAYLWRLRPAITRLCIIILGALLVAESLVVFPDYIAFFNFAVGGPRSGIHWLGDSNLDWGQDLKLLARWQYENLRPKNIPLYLCYFGIADPGAYGIEYVNYPGGYDFGPPQTLKRQPGVLAISATNLQGIYLNDAARQLYAHFHNRTPIAVLGGTIYLYQWLPDDINFYPAKPRAQTRPTTAAHRPS